MKKNDQFVYILEGRPTLVTDAGRTALAPGKDGRRVVYLEIGDRTPGDAATYPDDDIFAEVVDGNPRFTHKDGTPYA